MGSPLAAARRAIAVLAVVSLLAGGAAAPVLAAPDATAPIVTTPVVSPSLIVRGVSGAPTVTATASDPSGIASAEMSLDGGDWGPMAAMDGTFGGVSEGLTAGLTAGVGKVSSLSVGMVHNCGLLEDGRVTCWGDNASGELGGASLASSSSSPVIAAGISTATAISAGYLYTCALLADRTIRCWGSNTIGQLGDGTTTGSHTSGGPYANPVTVTGITTAIAVSAGWNHSCAILAGGTVRCWGWNQAGELGNGTTADSLTPVAVTGITNAVALSLGRQSTCAVLADGTIRCWGLNTYGQLGDGTTVNRSASVAVTGITTAVSVSADNYHTCALLGDATVRCWGDNWYGQLGDGTTSFGVASPVTFGATGVVAVSVGNASTCALLAGGAVWCSGKNSQGGLGDGTKTNRVTPVPVSGITTATAIGVGLAHACAMLASGTVTCWGANYTAQLGDGTWVDSTVPVASIALPTGTHEVCVRATDTASNTSAGGACATLGVVAAGSDTTAPTFSKAATVALRTAAALSTASTASAVPVTVSWAAADNADGSGLDHYTIEARANNGAWATLALATPLAVSAATTMPSTGTATFRVTAYDTAGNSQISLTGARSAALTQNTSKLVVFKGAWTLYKKSTFSGASDKYSRTKNAYATYVFTGRAIGLVSMKSKLSGQVKVYIDGKFKATVSLTASATAYRTVVWQYAFATSGKHTVKLLVVATRGKPRVDLDAFVVLR